MKLAVLALLVALLVSACQYGGSSDASEPEESAPTSTDSGWTPYAPVTTSAEEPETATLPDEPCSAVEVERLVTAFLRAFNEGDTLRLGALFAPAEDFEWYWTTAPGERADEEGRNRSTLMDYFEERHQAGERLRLRSFQFNGNSDGFGNFEYQLVRSADDLPATDYDGKGAAYCFDDRPDLIFVWAMGRA